MRQQIENRTNRLAINCWYLSEKLPQTRTYGAYINQFVRCSSSVGANYRASGRAKSKADFIYKLKIVEEEADETIYFLELLEEVNKEHRKEIGDIKDEAKQILKIIVASINTLKRK